MSTDDMPKESSSRIELLQGTLDMLSVANYKIGLNSGIF
jgi:hypothetical protein